MSTQIAAPRWGKLGRVRKAEAILATLQIHCGRDMSHATWVDIGCGNGGIAATLSSHVSRVIGFDPEVWNDWNSLRLEHANLTLHAASFMEMDKFLREASVDVVVCNQVYEHVDDPIALLKAIYHILRPGGVCYFAGPNMLWPIEPHLHWPFAHWLPRNWVMAFIHKFKIDWATRWDARAWTFWKLARAFRESGFYSFSAFHNRLRAEVELGGTAWYVRVLNRLPAWLLKLLTPVSPAFIFVIEKPATMTTSV